MTSSSPWRTLVRTPLGLAALVGVVFFAVLAVVAPSVWGHAASTVDVSALRQLPSGEHLLGTDSLGRDVLARIMVATRRSVGLALLATLIGVVGGVVVGSLPAVLGRRAGRLVTAAVNIAVAFPGLLVIIFLAVIFGVGTSGAVLAIGLAVIAPFARLTQTLAASIAGQDFVDAARTVGVGPLRLLLRHVLPNIADTLVVNAAIGAGGTLLAFSGLSFLGLGVQPPTYDWGRLLNEGLANIYTNPAAAVAPGVAVIMAGLAFTLLGEAAASAVGLRTGGRRIRRAVPAPGALTDEHPSSVRGEPLLSVRDLTVSFPAGDGWTTPVHGVSFDVARGETVGIVGESGSGKSQTALAVAGLVEPPAVVASTRLRLAADDLRGASDAALRQTLGTRMAMVFQDPMTSLNPALRIVRQLAEVIEEHEGVARAKAQERAVGRLGAVAIDRPEKRARQYPHELSGGMRQRVMIASGLMGRAELVIADEPTTALDVTVQQQVLRLLRRLRDENGIALLLISHDIAVVSSVCDRVLVMYGGKIVEDLPVSRLLDDAHHPYTRALIASVPQMAVDRTVPLATIPGRPPDPGQRPAGCTFAVRCSFATDRCREEEPVLLDAGGGHLQACWNPRSGPVALGEGTSVRESALDREATTGASAATGSGVAAVRAGA